MKILLPLAAAVEAAKDVAVKAPEAVGSGGTQEAIDHALWQYPVAALVIAVVVLFLRYMKKERDASAAERETQQSFLAETNKLDREDREKAQQRFTDTLQAVQVAQSHTIEKAVDSFATGLTQATSQQNTLMARAVDTIDRNTEALGEIKAIVEITRNQQAMRDDEDEEVEVRVRKKKRKKRPKSPPPEVEDSDEEWEDEG